MKKRVLLDEHIAGEIGTLFGAKAHVYEAAKVGLSRKPDDQVIDFAIDRKCFIVTNDQEFVETYRQHPRPRSRRGPHFFYGLMLVRAHEPETQARHVRKALAETMWDQTRQHDDVIIIDRDGNTHHVRLCHPECAKEYEEYEIAIGLRKP